MPGGPREDIGRRKSRKSVGRRKFRENFSDYLKIRNSNPVLRDEKYREMANGQFAYPQTRERHLHTQRPVYSPRGSTRPDSVRPFRPDLWYEWKVQKKDGKFSDNGKFNFQMKCRPAGPRKQNWLSGLSHPIKPKIEVTGWRKRVNESSEVGFQNDKVGFQNEGFSIMCLIY